MLRPGADVGEGQRDEKVGDRPLAIDHAKAFFDHPFQVNPPPANHTVNLWIGARFDDHRQFAHLLVGQEPGAARTGTVLQAVCPLTPRDVALMEAMMTTFGEAFGQVEVCCPARPSSSYLESLLASKDFMALAALNGGAVVGGLVAYELHKFEQERSEIYIYDFAVAAAHRREGIATALIEELKELKKIAAARGAYVVVVRADKGDAPATALYTKLGTREDVLHFDIEITPK